MDQDLPIPPSPLFTGGGVRSFLIIAIFSGIAMKFGDSLSQLRDKLIQMRIRLIRGDYTAVSWGY